MLKSVSIITLVLVSLFAFADVARADAFQPGVVKLEKDAEGNQQYCIRGKLYDDSGFLGMYKNLHKSCGSKYKHITIRDGGVNLDQ